MRVIVVVCAAFGLTVSEAKTEIMCLRTEGMSESTATFSVEAAGQVYNQTNEFALPRGECQAQCRPVHRGRPAHTQRMVQLPEVHPRTCTTDRALPSSSKSVCQEPRYSRQCCTAASRGARARVPLRHAAPSPPQVPDSLHRLATVQSRRPPDFLSGHAYEDGK